MIVGVLKALLATKNQEFKVGDREGQIAFKEIQK
jgi:hypothetical protein